MSGHTNQNQSPLTQAKKACLPGFIAAGTFSLVLNVLVLTGPIFMLQVYDRVLSSQSTATLIGLSILAVGLYVFYGMFDGLRGRLLTSLGALFDQSVRGAAFDATARIERNGSTTSGAGSALSDVDHVRTFVTGNGLPALFDLPWMPLYLAAVFLLHPMLGIFGLVGAVILIAIAAINEFVSRRQAPAARDASVQANRILADVNRNAQTIKAMGMRDVMKDRWLSAYVQSTSQSVALGKRASLFASLTKTTRFIIQSGSLALGAYFAIQGEISAGAMIAVSIILSRALAPVEQVIGNWRSLALARVSLRRLSEDLTVDSTTINKTALPLPTKRLDVNKLTVAPPGEKSLVLKGISLCLEAGDGLAVIGPSGAGKSSLARALVGIWQAAQGDVRFDDAPLTQYDEDTIGRFVGYLPQTIELFEGTVAENISRFRPEASSEAVIEAAKLAGCHQMILDLENGYDTQIGSGGGRLSGGQRQRIALARAVFDNPFIVVLDEPNSNLDNNGEIALNATITNLRQAGRIVVTVAHRPSALAAINKVAVIQSGTLTKFGEKDYVMKQLAGEQRQANGSTLKAVNG